MSLLEFFCKKIPISFDLKNLFGIIYYLISYFPQTYQSLLTLLFMKLIYKLKGLDFRNTIEFLKSSR